MVFVFLESFFTITLRSLSFPSWNTGSLDPIHAFVSIASAIVCSALIPCSVLLLQAVFSNTRSILLVPWLVLDMLLRGIHLIILISGIVLAASGSVSHGVATVIIMTFGIGKIRILNCEISVVILICHAGLESYLWWIILCYYRELDRHETVCMAAANCELVPM